MLEVDTPEEVKAPEEVHTAEIQFQPEIVGLLTRVMAELRSDARTVIVVSQLHMQITKSQKEPVKFTLSDLGNISNLVKDFNKYTVQDGVFLPHLSSALGKAVHEIEIKMKPVQEPIDVETKAH